MPESKRAKNVLIVGGGVGGMATAIFLQDLDGVNVTLLDAQSSLGGLFNTIYASPMFYYPERKEMGALEKHLGKDKVDAFHSDLVKSVSELEAKGLIKNKFKSGFKNYEADEDIYNTYALDMGGPLLHALGRLVYKIIAPAALFQSHLNEMKVGRNTKHVAQRLIQGIKKSGAKIVLNTKVQSVKKDFVETSDGRSFSYDILVLACGGAGRNVDLLYKLYGKKLTSHEYNKINDGLSLKAALSNKWKYNKELLSWYAEAVELNSGKFSAVLFLSGPAVMVVDSTGKRVYDEKLVYNLRGKTTAKHGELILVSDVPNMKRFVSDSRLLPPEYLTTLPPLSAAKHVRAKSVSELCAVLQADKHFDVTENFTTNFIKQFETYQHCARTGIDNQFRRGERRGEHLDSKKHTSPPNPAILRIDESEIVAFKLKASTLDTCSGPVVDKDSRVLQENGQAVHNVFAVGNCSASIVDGHYVSAGIPISSAFVGAFRVARAVRVLDERKGT